MGRRLIRARRSATPAAIALLITLACGVEVEGGVPESMKISRSMIENMFASMEGKPGWDLDSELVWDFFFTDSSEAKLQEAAAVLEARGYETVCILYPSEDADDRETLFLQMRRLEHHTVDSLLVRNDELYEFAAAQGLDSYDGMDMSRPGTLPD